MPVQAPSPSPTGNQSHALDDLRRRVAGRLHTPADPSWDAVRTPWVVNVPQHPMAVLEVRDADDVVAAVRWAVDHGVQVTAQPTGHGAGPAFDQVLLLRTRGLDGIEVDVERRTAWVGAGVKSGELLAQLDGTGLTFLAGSNPDPTVVGMTITGGISWFGRGFGLGADSIVTVEIVDGLGRLRRLSATEDAELFWAVRGGGGDFGIITRIEVALHPAPEVYGGRLLWPVEQMGRGAAHLPDGHRDRARGAVDLVPHLPVPAAARGARADPRQGVRLDRRRLPRLPRGRRGAARAVPVAAGSGDGPDGRGADGRARLHRRRAHRPDARHGDARRC